MNQFLFEGRSLVGIVSSIIRQDDLKVSFSRLDWERMFRLADYHKVASIVYLGILGYREALPEKWQARFLNAIRSHCCLAVLIRSLSRKC